MEKLKQVSRDKNLNKPDKPKSKTLNYRINNNNNSDFDIASNYHQRYHIDKKLIIKNGYFIEDTSKNESRHKLRRRVEVLLLENIIIPQLN